MLFPPLIAFGQGVVTGHFSDLSFPGLLAYATNFTAMGIGSVITHWFMGFTKRKSSDKLQQWKEYEVEHGVLHTWFERLRLTHFLEYGGSIYARLAVVAFLVIALFVPLQLTINQIGTDLEMQEEFQALSNEVFEIEGRSGILSLTTEPGRESVKARIQILSLIHI